MKYIFRHFQNPSFTANLSTYSRAIICLVSNGISDQRHLILGRKVNFKVTQNSAHPLTIIYFHLPTVFKTFWRGQPFRANANYSPDIFHGETDPLRLAVKVTVI